MNTELITPFVTATKKVIETMAATPLTAGEPRLIVRNRAWGAVTGVIGMAGPTVSGNMLLSFDRSSILFIVTNMLGEEFREINEQVIDAVGELTNMISGGAKPQLAELGYQCEMALPITLVGDDVQIIQAVNTEVVNVQFDTAGQGSFVVEAYLKQHK